jgi:16S rRNA (cytidine1402-2'-O)-methyltransferase
VPLVVCPTPIGNLDDVTLRVLRELAEADLVLCEDTRHTRILLARHGIQATLESFHRHNEARRAAEIIPRLQRGERIALASDAGLPGVNDPGAGLIVAALEREIEVVVLPGASAVETALVASGLVGERYTFVGYLPRTEAGRARLWQEISGWTWPVVAFESPKRLPVSLASLAGALPRHRVAVCRELTKRYEEVIRGTTKEVAERFRDAPKGEITVVVEGAGEPAAPGTEEAASVAVADLVRAGVARRQAAELVSRLTGLSRNRLYRESL